MNKNNNDYIEIAIPESIASLELPDPALLEYYQDLEERTLFLNCEVDDDIVVWSKQIIKWNKEDAKLNVPIEERRPIIIYINTDGGDLQSILNLIDVISISKTPVYTIGLGKCYSAGGLLLMAGHKRFIFHNTTFLLHDGYTGGMGTVGKELDRLEFTKKQEVYVKDFVLTHSKITSKEYDRNYTRDWFMLSDDIIKYSVADKIITGISEVV